MGRTKTEAVEIPINAEKTEFIHGDLTIPKAQSMLGVCVFAHGSGSSRFSPRNKFVARVLNYKGIGTLLMDLLTLDEEQVDERTAEHRFNIPLLTSRVIRSIDYLKGREDESLGRLPIATFGASTGAAAALGAAVYRPNDVYCVVSRGGRPDLVPPNQLKDVQCPTLFLVGSKDQEVLEMNQRAYECLGSHVRRVEIVPGASHLFEEQGTLEIAAQHAAGFLVEHLTKAKKEWVREE